MLKYNLNSKLLFIILFAVSCSNSPELNGRIALYGNKLELYHETMVELKVSNKFTDKIYNIKWTVTPANYASLLYNENNSNNKKYKSDRSAVLIPLHKGDFTIKVFADTDSNKNKILIAQKIFHVE